MGETCRGSEHSAGNHCGSVSRFVCFRNVCLCQSVDAHNFDTNIGCLKNKIIGCILFSRFGFDEGWAKTLTEQILSSKEWSNTLCVKTIYGQADTTLRTKKSYGVP